MSTDGDRKLGAAFGLIGAGLLVLEALLDLVRGVVYLTVGHGAKAFGPFDEALILIVVGIVVAVFSAIGGVRRQDRALVSGAVLVVIALAGWLLLGLTSGVIALLGTIFVLIAGVVFLASSR
ncbi:MAG TPA: hypothetical protein VLX64_03640 [Thermoplasmata archaeon]|nr:hypothetical protein [Thermoplasmata archaeon]